MRTDGVARARSPASVVLPRPATVAAVLAVLVVWQLLAQSLPDYRFPGLGVLIRDVVAVLAGETRFDPAPQYGATIVRVLVGFAVSLALATVWGVAMGAREALGEYLSGPLFVFLTVPSVVWAFLGVIWFGLSEFVVPVLVVVLVVFPYLTVTVWKGMGDVDEGLAEMARVYGVGETDVWRDVYLPQLRPYLFGAARVGLAVAWKLSLVAEVFGSATGVGVAVKYHFETFETGLVLAWAVPMMLLIYGADRLLRRLERRAGRWRSDETDVLGAVE